MLLIAILALLQSAPPAADLDPPRPLSQWIYTRWTTQDGAPRTILHLAQSPDGYMWLTAWGRGLFRFDGVRFVPIPLRIGDTLPMRGVERIVPASDNSLWLVLAEGKVGHLKRGYLEAWGEAEGVPRAFEMTMSSTGVVVVGTARGIHRYADGRWQDMKAEWSFPGKQCRAIWFDSKDGLWASTDDRMVYLPPGGTAFRDVGLTYKRPNGPSPRFAEGKDGTIWMGEQWRSVHTIPMQDGNRAMTEVLVGAKNVVVDRKGSLWIGTAGDGLRRILDPTRVLGRRIEQFDSSSAEIFSEAHGLLADAINIMFVDREGSVWVSGDRGLERFREPPLTPIGSRSSRRARLLYPTRDTSLWIAPYSAEIQRLRAGIPQPGVKAGFAPSPLAQSRDGRLWTTDSRFLYRLDGPPPYVPVRMRSREMRVGDIRGDRDGNLWVFDNAVGLMRLDGDSLVLEAAVTDSVYPHASLLTDSQGSIWMSFFKRLVRYRSGQLTTFPLGGVGTFGSEAWSLVEDSSGAIWVGGQFGLGRLEGDRFRSLTRMPGGIVMTGLTIDDAGAWWYATREGLVRIAPGEVHRAMADSSHVIRHRLFSQSDGLPGEINGNLYGPVVTRTADGMVWVATDSGVASIDPKRLPPVVVPPALIETIRVDEHELRPDSGLTISAQPRNIEIDYTAMTLATAERMQFRYQLVGEDSTWREVGTRRRAYYTGLGPGSYTFRVISGTADGEWSEDVASSTFRVLPTWYQTLWFKAVMVLCIGGLGAALAALIQRVRHRREQQELRGQYEATLAERARIAQDLHDTLLQGFAGVSLQLKTAELALPEQPDVAAETLVRVQQLTRDSLREARERVWEMRDSELGGNDLPQALEAVARERVRGTPVEVVVNTTGERRRLLPAIEDVAFRVGREALVNAVRHAAPTRIELTVAYLPTSVRLTIQDDGAGFTPAAAEEARRQGHFGLSGMRDRATRIGGRCEVAPREGGGTVVTVDLPTERT